MINGERCTRACGFCLVDTRQPRAARRRRAGAGGRGRRRAWACAFAVLTAVARDDLADGGAAAFAATIAAIRRRTPGRQVEVLIPDCKGDPDALGADLRGPARRAEPQPRDRRPPAAGRAPVGLLRPQPGRAGPGQGGRARHQVRAHRRAWARPTTRSWPTLADLAAVGVDIVTIGQYLRPTAAPPARSPAGGRPRRSTAGRQAGEALGHRPRRGQPAHPLELPRRARLVRGRSDVGRAYERSRRHPESSLDRRAARVLRGHRAVGRRRAREPVAQGLRHASGCSARTGRLPRPHRAAASETIAHLRQNGRITFMFCAFEGKPQILRLFGRGRVLVLPDDEEFDELAAVLPGAARAPRSVIVVDLERHRRTRAATPCRVLDYEGEREHARSSGPSARVPTACAALPRREERR